LTELFAGCVRGGRLAGLVEHEGFYGKSNLLINFLPLSVIGCDPGSHHAAQIGDWPHRDNHDPGC